VRNVTFGLERGVVVVLAFLVVVIFALGVGLVFLAVRISRLKEQMEQEADGHRQVLLAISDALIVTNAQGQITMLNRRAEKLTGYSREEALGRAYDEIVCIEHSTADPLREVLRGQRMSENNASLVSRSGTEVLVREHMVPLFSRSGEVEGAILTLRPTAGWDAKEKELDHDGAIDSLTGLYNRAYFDQELLRLDQPEYWPLSILMGDLNGLKLTNDIFGHSKGDELLVAVSQVLRDVCRPEDSLFRWGGDEFIVLMPKLGKEEVIMVRERLQEALQGRVVCAIPVDLPLGCGTKEDESQDIRAVCQQAEEEMYWMKTINQTQFERETLNAIMNELYSRSSGEREHAERVSRLAEELGRHLGLGRDDLRGLRVSGLLHDIGKVALEPELLECTNPLEPETEWEMKRHPLVGFRLLNLLEETADLAAAVLAHHEWWDGSGYPRGLKGEEIPLFARILAVVETYDRVQADSVDKALALIREGAGYKFDPALSAAFLDMMERPA